jgi:hypothetical protein
MQLQNRLDQLLGNNQAILTRQREAELKAMHELNRPLAQAIYDLEDAEGAVQGAFAALSASIQAEKTRATAATAAQKEAISNSFSDIIDGLTDRLDVANEALSRSSSIYNMLESAVSGRSVTSGISQTLSRREGALSFIRGGDFSDEKRLEEALGVVAEPTKELFGSFIDYARDFARTSLTLEGAKKVAQIQLTADEKSVILLEEQIDQARVNLEDQLKQADFALESQLASLDQQYEMMVQQYNELRNIDTSVKGVSSAVGSLGAAFSALASAQAAASTAAASTSAGSSSGSSSTATSSAVGQQDILNAINKDLNQGRVDISGTNELLAAASVSGVSTSGKTGLEIFREVAAKVEGAKHFTLDMDTSHKQFAMGGYHTGGLRMVGERGPELEATGPSRIFSHSQTSGMFRDPDLKEAVNDLRRSA